MSGSPSRISNRTRAIARVIALLTIASAICSIWCVQRAKAAGEKALFGLGDHMMRYAGAPNQTTPVEVKLNGASFFVSHAAVDASVTEILDVFQAKCVAKNGQIGASWAEAAGLSGRTLSGLSGVKELKKEHGILDGVLRSETADAGFVVCMEAADGTRVEPSELVDGVRSFLATGDAADVGHMRYVRVSRGERRSVFVALWTEGPLPLRAMFPTKGDAPGRDPEGLPRPPRSRRLLSSEQIGRNVLLTIYGQEAQKPSASEHASSSQKLAQFYRSMLQERGYTLLESSNSAASMLVARKDGQMVTVAFGVDDEGHALATLSTRPD